MVTKIHQFHNVPRIWPVLQKRRTSVEWTWWHHRKANNKVFPPKQFGKLGPCSYIYIQYIFANKVKTFNRKQNEYHSERCLLAYKKLARFKTGWEPIYYHGPHELCIIAGGPQKKTFSTGNSATTQLRCLQYKTLFPNPSPADSFQSEVIQRNYANKLLGHF